MPSLSPCRACAEMLDPAQLAACAGSRRNRHGYSASGSVFCPKGLIIPGWPHWIGGARQSSHQRGSSGPCKYVLGQTPKPRSSLYATLFGLLDRLRRDLFKTGGIDTSSGPSESAFLAFFTTEIGPNLARVHHLYYYKDYDVRDKVRAAVGKDSR